MTLDAVLVRIADAVTFHVCFEQSTAAEREGRMDAIQEVEMRKHTSLRDDDNSV